MPRRGTGARRRVRAVKPFLKAITIGRQRPVGLILLHGLFANSAFWLPYLRYFVHCRIILLDIDYGALFASGAPLAALNAELEALTGDAPQHLLAHSFGCCAAVALPSAFLSRSLVCPTFAARDYDRQRFIADLVQLHGADRAHVGTMFDAALRHKQDCAQGVAYRPGDALYLARDDPYFDYAPSTEIAEVHFVRGGHFTIGEAVAAIARSRLGYTDPAPAS